ncbi:hypothetical protein Brsp06_04682 [Brucella sp. NBRC 13694]
MSSFLIEAVEPDEVSRKIIQSRLSLFDDRIRKAGSREPYIY